MKKKIGAILAVIIVFLNIWYHIPVKVEKKVPVSTIDGDMKEIILEVSWNRFLLRPTELRGKITFDNIVYYSIQDNKISFQRRNIFEMTSNKLRGERSMPKFIISSDNVISLQNEFIYPVAVDYDFEQFSLLYKKNDDEIIYYGIASTGEEARRIEKELVNAD